MDGWSFDVEDVPGDGNCMFHSVGRAVGVSAAELREGAVQWMRADKQMLHGELVSEWIQWNGNMHLEAYTRQMERSGTWGGGIELAVLSTLLRRPILVYARERPGAAQRIAEFLPDLPQGVDVNKLPVICILYVGRSHYMSLKPKKT